jgi:8-hydroxy-5-deazaflavin:NADPH oxidoreductase
MSNVTIFGTGNMGSAIASVLAAGGASVDHIGTDGRGSVTGDVVVLAVPYSALADITAKYAEQLEGKIVVETTNPLDFATFDSLVVPTGSSATAQLAKALPSSRVLKGFNTTFAATLATKKVGDLATTVLLAGDDAAAKETVIGLIAAGGVQAIDAGSLSRAHELEAMGFLQLTLAAGEKINWTGGFGIVK